MKKILALILMLSMIFSMFACSSPAANESGEQAGESGGEANDHLTVVISSDPSNLDPSDSDNQTHYQVTRQIYETLFIYDENDQLQPWLCESYEYEDDCTLILKIRQGVKFHNGDELKASDVYFSFKRIHEQNIGGGLADIPYFDVEKSEVLDDYTLKFVTTTPAASQLSLLEGPATGIMSERAYTEANGDFLNGACVGTGPYKLVSYSAGDKTELTAFDDYWVEGEPKIKDVTIRVISESASRAVEAESLGADLIYDIGATDIDMVDAAEGVSIVQKLGTNTSHLLFNTAKAPLDNPLVREAIWYAVDAEAAVKLASGDFGSFAQGWVCPGILGFDADLAAQYMPKRDVEKAKQLLAEAGYPDGLELEIACQGSNQERLDMSEAFQAQLAEAGITLNLNVMESGTWNEYVITGQHQLTIYGFSCADLESDRALNQLMPSHGNYALCNYDNPEFQATVETACSTLDTETRAQLYADAAEMLMRDFVTLPLWHKSLAVAVKDGVAGFEITRSYENHYLQSVYFE